MVRYRFRLNARAVAKLGGNSILHFTGGGLQRGPGDSDSGIVGQGNDVIDESRQGFREHSQMTADRALPSGISHGARLTESNGCAGAVLSHQESGASAVQVDAVVCAEEKQPCCAFVIIRAIAITWLAAVDSHQIEEATILRKFNPEFPASGAHLDTPSIAEVAPLPARHERGEGWGEGLVPSNCRALLKSHLLANANYFKNRATTVREPSENTRQALVQKRLRIMGKLT